MPDLTDMIRGNVDRSVLFLVVVLCYLMVSNVRYRTFKDFKPKAKNVPIVVGVLALGGVVAMIWHPSAALVLLIGGYIFMGLLEEVLFFKKRRAETAA